jgi:hypothetical protein
MNGEYNKDSLYFKVYHTGYPLVNTGKQHNFKKGVMSDRVTISCIAHCNDPVAGDSRFSLYGMDA